jgi:hypothetical protein
VDLEEFMKSLTGDRALRLSRGEEVIGPEASGQSSQKGGR